MTDSTRRRLLYAAGVISTAGLTSSTVSATQHSENDDNGTEPEEDTEFNQVDIMFVRMMIPHHEGAIQMAELVPERTDREELLNLQTEIIEEQEAEIDQMCDLLDEADAAGCDEVGSMMPHEMRDMMHGNNMDGMMDEQEMQEMMPREYMMTHDDRRELRRSEGQEFDCLFAHHMIRHHEGAVVMSEHVIDEGESERIDNLAQEIIEAQQEEIEMMEEWQAEWDC